MELRKVGEGDGSPLAIDIADVHQIMEEVSMHEKGPISDVEIGTWPREIEDIAPSTLSLAIPPGAEGCGL